MFGHYLNCLWFGLVWLVECWFEGIFEVFDPEILLDFASRPISSTSCPGSSFQLVDSDTLSSCVWFLHQ